MTENCTPESDKTDLIDELLSEEFLTKRLTGRSRFSQVNKYVKYRPGKVAKFSRNWLERELREKSRKGVDNDKKQSSGNLLAVENFDGGAICLSSDGRRTVLRRCEFLSDAKGSVCELRHESPVLSVHLVYDRGEDEAAVYLRHGKSVGLYVIAYENGEGPGVEEVVAGYEFEVNVVHSSTSRFYGTRVYYALEDNTVGYINFENGHAENHIIFSHAQYSYIQPQTISPFQAFLLNPQKSEAYLLDTRSNKPKQTCKVADSLDKIGSLCELSHDLRKLAISDTGRIDLYDIRCPGRRLYAWDTNTFGTVEDKYISANILTTTKIEITTSRSGTDLYPNSGVEVLVAASTVSNKVQAFPVDHSDVDIFGQVTRHRDARLDPSDILKIDSVEDIIFPLLPGSKARIYDLESTRGLDISGLAVQNGIVYSLYGNALITQDLNTNPTEYQLSSASTGFEPRECAIYSQIRNSSPTIQVTSKNQIYAEFSNSGSSDSDEELLETCRSNFARLQKEEKDTPDRDCPELFPRIRSTGAAVTNKDLKLLGGASDENVMHDNYHSRLAGLWDSFKYIRLEK